MCTHVKWILKSYYLKFCKHVLVSLYSSRYKGNGSLLVFIGHVWGSFYRYYIPLDNFIRKDLKKQFHKKPF